VTVQDPYGVVSSRQHEWKESFPPEALLVPRQSTTRRGLHPFFPTMPPERLFFRGGGRHQSHESFSRPWYIDFVFGVTVVISPSETGKTSILPPRRVEPPGLLSCLRRVPTCNCFSEYVTVSPLRFSSPKTSQPPSDVQEKHRAFVSCPMHRLFVDVPFPQRQVNPPRNDGTSSSRVSLKWPFPNDCSSLPYFTL